MDNSYTTKSNLKKSLQRVSSEIDLVDEKTEILTDICDGLDTRINTLESGTINENLLINGDFRYTINQRKKTTYNSSGYCIDGWYLTSGSSLTVLEDGLLIESPENGFARILQKCEYDYVGVFTYSVFISEGTGTMFVKDHSPAVSINGYGVYSVTVNGPNPVNAVYLDAANGSSIKVVAAKLEAGGRQTLAHKEGNIWVLNDIPNPSLELMKCKRYYNVLYLNYTFRRSDEGTALRTGLIQFPEMRAKPSVSVTGTSGITVNYVSTKSFVVNSGSAESGTVYITLCSLDANL